MFREIARKNIPPYLGFSIVNITALLYFLAWLDNMDTTKYVFKGSKSQVGSSSSNKTGSLISWTPIISLLYSELVRLSTFRLATCVRAKSARTCLTLDLFIYWVTYNEKSNPLIILRLWWGNQKKNFLFWYLRANCQVAGKVKGLHHCQRRNQVAFVGDVTTIVLEEYRAHWSSI